MHRNYGLVLRIATIFTTDVRALHEAFFQLMFVLVVRLIVVQLIVVECRGPSAFW